MADAGRDNNRNTTLLVESSVSATTILNLTATPIAGVNPLNVAITDASGVQITTFGASTADQSTFTPATTAGGISMGVYQTSPTTLSNNQAAAIGIDSKRRVKSAIYDAAGNDRGVNVNASNQLSVSLDNTPSVNQGTSPWVVGGNVASLATDSGNPVKVGGVYNTSFPAPTNGQRVDLQSDSNGIVYTNLAYKLDSTNDSVTAVAQTATGVAVPANAFYIGVSDGTNLRGAVQIINAINSTGTGIMAAGLVAQLDNTSPTVPTENQFSNLRLHKIRSLMASPWSGTGTQTSVGDSASSVTVLAANLDRIGATIFNDSGAILYIKFGATASATSYITQIPSNGYYEVPYGYTGIIDGIWASDAGGNARVTEMT